MDSLGAAVYLEQRQEVKADLWRKIAEIQRRRGTYAAAHEGLARAEACLAGAGSPLELARVRIARSMLAGSRRAAAQAPLLGAETTALLVDPPQVERNPAPAYRPARIAAAREA